MKHSWGVALSCLAVLVACSTREPQTTDELEPIGVLVEGPCPVPVPDGLVEGESIRCGTVAVPEFHVDLDSRRLHLQAAVFPSIGESPSKEPMFVATAGPGASGIESITPEVAGPLGDAILAARDLVLIDYRGLPLAEPNLMCPEIIERAFQSLGQALTDEEAMTEQIEAVAACRDRLRAEGVTLEAYNNAETAADIAMVMTALGYDRFHVYGTSAGTILAQHLMRDFPDRLASVVIDSTVPVGRGNVHTEAPTVAAETLDALLRHCEEDADCAEAFPNLRQETNEIIDRYDSEPVILEVTHPQSGEPLTLALTGHRLAQGILMLNSQTPTVGMVPLFIHKLANGETEIVKEMLWAIGPPVGNFAWALGTSIFCREYSDFTEDEIVYPGIFPAYEQHIATQAFGGRTIARTCAIWGVDPIAPGLNTPVRSDVPVLLMAGTLDSLTPPSWAREVALNLPNSHVVEIEGYAHSPTFAGECTAMMALQFFADPSQAPDDSCLADLEIQFALPE